jgi:hypothetical protein
MKPLDEPLKKSFHSHRDILGVRRDTPKEWNEGFISKIPKQATNQCTTTEGYIFY